MIFVLTKFKFFLNFGLITEFLNYSQIDFK